MISNYLNARREHYQMMNQSQLLLKRLNHLRGHLQNIYFCMNVIAALLYGNWKVCTTLRTVIALTAPIIVVYFMVLTKSDIGDYMVANHVTDNGLLETQGQIQNKYVMNAMIIYIRTKKDP